VSADRIREVFRQACLYSHAADDLLCQRLAEAVKPQAEPVASVAWQEGYRAGVNDERISEANIGIAGFGAKVEPNRNNPYAAPQPQAALLTNPYTGTPRDYRDVESDPAGVLIQEPGAPLRAAKPRPQDFALVQDAMEFDWVTPEQYEAWQRIKASLVVGK